MLESRAIQNKTAQWMILLVERKEPKQKKAQWMKPSVVITGGIFYEVLMKLTRLTHEFYNTYKDCKEILKKKDRPYACLTIEVDGLLYAIPFRHHIAHKYAFKTIGEAGLDYTKAVVITSIDYLETGEARIETAEFNIIKRNEAKIRYDFKKYVNQYRRAMKHRDNPRSHNILAYSALQYFEEYL